MTQNAEQVGTPTLCYLSFAHQIWRRLLALLAGYLMLIGALATTHNALAYALSDTASKTKVYDDTEDEEMAFYGGAFRPRPGIAGVIGLTTNSFVASFNFVHQHTPDLISLISIGITTGRDPAEIDRFDPLYGQTFTFGPDGFPKKSGLVMLTSSFGLQQRLFRRDITSSFRPFVEVGAGPTIGYIHMISRLPDGLADIPQNYEFSGTIFNPRGITLGVNGYVGAGAYFGANFLSLQGLTVRYIANYLPAGVELLRGSRVSLFHGISINLIFGTLYN
ncbi:MAG: hypothetical protein RMI34_02260 [Chloroherpetonaceae bacterium]|nr:hypothetical protein [Chloroherpetonaceae bacterium]MCS7212571.1 hypothetical protein [Chloroherpetonaceae bacterium]MDW8018879.1 hypothetical protein [Chloroherpetonaceae bacterium]MDW8466674.1 hypothetical protein [Chloroherpetonaceae bacterium]